ncbi:MULTISPECIES: pilus assembly protein N-terminal domain-containing protein [Pannonibacter]|uniref:Pilus formation protein N terminal region n=1 Tax=Pannonibacter indicus TaxID=466044 RepID=A0A0K6HTS5_9HYPH|nr:MULTISPECIES: pilus assembly protein N-terminal domain-containing protein [Pannonibacter]CUA94163.1 Pilus formation protein N terminal region [Pannonibacter indicus]
MPRIPHSLIPLAGLAVLLPVALAAAEGVSVPVDQSKVFRIEQPASTVIVGNPVFAAVTMHDRYTVVVTGKSAGTTNLIILDANSEPIIDEPLTVTAGSQNTVTVMRKDTRYSYSCAPDCDAIPLPGDGKDVFTTTAEQINQRDQMALQAAGKASAGQPVQR